MIYGLNLYYMWICSKKKKLKIKKKNLLLRGKRKYSIIPKIYQFRPDAYNKLYTVVSFRDERRLQTKCCFDATEWSSIFPVNTWTQTARLLLTKCSIFFFPCWFYWLISLSNRWNSMLFNCWIQSVSDGIRTEILHKPFKTGKTFYIIFFVQCAFPWEMRECVFPEKIETKTHDVIENREALLRLENDFVEPSG